VYREKEKVGGISGRGGQNEDEKKTRVFPRGRKGHWIEDIMVGTEYPLDGRQRGKSEHYYLASRKWRVISP